MGSPLFCGRDSAERGAALRRRGGAGGDGAVPDGRLVIHCEKLGIIRP